ncbi:MAG TPA: hypothetical protein VH437_12830 [Terriglobales bacterium]|jgi:hypothetical protein
MTTRVNRSALYATATIVLIHLLVNFAHGWAHRQLEIGLTTFQSAFVIIVVLALPLLALQMVWAARIPAGLRLLSASMFAALMFGLYHHFLLAGPDHIHSQPDSTSGAIFVVSSYLLLITEAIGTYIGIHFLRGEQGLR